MDGIHTSSYDVVHEDVEGCLECLEVLNKHLNSLISFSPGASECIVASVWHVTGKVAVATSLHRRKNIPETSYCLAGSSLHGMPLRRHGPPDELEAAELGASSLELD